MYFWKIRSTEIKSWEKQGLRTTLRRTNNQQKLIMKKKLFENMNHVTIYYNCLQFFCF